MCLLAVPYLVNAVLDYTPALDTNVLTEATNNNSSLTDTVRPGGKVHFVVSYPGSERSELVAYHASKAARSAAERALAGVWGRSPQRGPGAEPLAGG